jgi:phosphatidyl-myo-inositol dimannoside synthase
MMRASTSNVTEIVVSGDCPPMIGGAHLWLYETYKRWPHPVWFLTTQAAVAGEQADAQRHFDSGDNGALQIVRSTPPFSDIDLFDARCCAGFKQYVDDIRRLSGSTFTRLHALRAFPEGFAALLAKLKRPRRTRLITYAHGEEILVARASRQLKWMAKLTFRASDLVIANSENTRRLVLALCPKARVERISPGVEVSSFARDDERIGCFRARLGLDSTTVLLGTIARMEPRKNQAAVINSIAMLRESGIPLLYFCAGQGPEQRALKDLATSLGVCEAVHFPGPIAECEKGAAFGAFDVHVMPSIQVGEMIEGFGIVFMEAAAAKTPSICGASGGQAEAVRHGETGLVVDGMRLDRVCDAIRQLAADRSMRTRMGEAAFEWAKQHDWKIVCKQTVSAIGRYAT